MSLYRFIFGSINYEQISRTDLEHRLRAQHRLRIDELESLGFYYFCSYTESFAAYRLLFLLPALVVLSMLAGREMIRLHRGRIHTYMMLFVSKDSSTYASIFRLGVAFYTGFSDGTFLVTMNGTWGSPISTGHPC